MHPDQDRCHPPPKGESDGPRRIVTACSRRFSPSYVRLVCLATTRQGTKANSLAYSRTSLSRSHQAPARTGDRPGRGRDPPLGPRLSVRPFGRGRTGTSGPTDHLRTRVIGRSKRCAGTRAVVMKPPRPRRRGVGRRYVRRSRRRAPVGAIRPNGTPAIRDSAVTSSTGARVDMSGTFMS